MPLEEIMANLARQFDAYANAEKDSRQEMRKTANAIKTLAAGQAKVAEMLERIASRLEDLPADPPTPAPTASPMAEPMPAPSPTANDEPAVTRSTPATPSPPPKRKRGRPPKKRPAETTATPTQQIVENAFEPPELSEIDDSITGLVATDGEIYRRPGTEGAHLLTPEMTGDIVRGAMFAAPEGPTRANVANAIRMFIADACGGEGDLDKLLERHADKYGAAYSFGWRTMAYFIKEDENIIRSEPQ